MSNSLYNSIGPKRHIPDQNGLNRIINAFNNYKQNFNGNPEQMAQELMQSGQMSEAWFNQMKPMADFLYRFTKR